MNILYILSSFNRFSGTPKKTLDLINHSEHKSFLYVYYKNHLECKKDFEINTVEVLEGYYGNNIYKHISSLLKFIDKNNIELVQTQFLMGEILGSLIKLFRPKIKIIVAFVGPFSPKGIKHFITSLCYKNIDSFVYISKYVEKEKKDAYKILNNKPSTIIYNGTNERIALNKHCSLNLKNTSLIDVAALIDWKNTIILIEAMNILINKKQKKAIYLYLLGDGDQKEYLQNKIISYNLMENIFILGKEDNVGGYLKECDIFVHPAYAEGFGIAVAEAMIAKKPMILANAGAHPELIKNNESGLLVDPHNKEEWSEAILKLIENKDFANILAINAKKSSDDRFSIENYIQNYKELYLNVLKKEK